MNELVASVLSFWLAVAGWAVLHLLWQGAVLGVVLEATLLLLRRARPASRERVALLGLLALVAVFAATCARVAGRALDAEPLAVRQSAAALTVDSDRSLAPRESLTELASTRATRARALATAIPVVGAVWLLLVAWRMLRLYAGARRLHQVRTRALPMDPTRLAADVERIATRLRIRQRVPILLSADVEVPALAGWRSPVVLLPHAVAEALSDAALAGVIAHELAHLRRADVATHMLQMSVRALLFFHPVAHRLGRVVEREREQCCDDLAIAAGAAPLDYARGLARLERLRPLAPAFGVAATGGPLLDRVRRIVQPQPVLARRHTFGAVAGGVIATVLASRVAVAFVGAGPIDSTGMQRVALRFAAHRAEHHAAHAKPAHAQAAPESLARRILEHVDGRDDGDDVRIRIRLDDSADPARASDFIALASDADASVRDKALWVLGRSGDRRAVEPAIAALRDAEPRVRRSAAAALGRLGDARAVEPLAACLQDPSPDVREAARAALLRLGDPRASPPGP